LNDEIENQKYFYKIAKKKLEIKIIRTEVEISTPKRIKL
jgi:hypothetical protein